MLYAKLFPSLWDGTLGGDWETWSVFVFLLAHADMDGVVDMTPSAISRRSSIPIESVKRALEILESPDPDSRSDELGGRRLERLDEHRSWGWRVVNARKYRDLRNTDQVRAGNAERQRRRRERMRGVTPVTSHAVTSSVTPSHAHIDVDSDLESGAASQRASSDAPDCPVSLGDGEDDYALGLDQSDTTEAAASARAAFWLLPPDVRKEMVASQARANANRWVEGDPGGEPRTYPKAIAELTEWQFVPGRQRAALMRRAMQIAARLYSSGITRSDLVIVGIVQHWLTNRDRIENPFAYYSPGSDGAIILAGLISANAAVAEAEAHKAVWKDAPRGTHATTDAADD